MSARRFATALLSISALPAIARAHPGHGAAGGSYDVLHYLTEPLHAVVGVAALALVLASFVALRRRASRR